MILLPALNNNLLTRNERRDLHNFVARQKQRLNSIVQHQAQITHRWICTRENCRNKDNFCFIDSDGLHYEIKTAAQERWATAINAGESTVETPPIAIYNYWVQ
jgi:hypothetical protein